MRNLKKILSLVLALMMVLSVMVTASATDFVDDEDINYKEAVEVMTGIGVINGVGDEFLPQDYLNRAAAAKIVAYILEGGELNANIVDAIANPFSDVSGWAEAPIKYCYANGVVDGMGDGTFLPKDYLTGYAFAKMLLIAAGIDGEYTGSNWKLNIATAAKNAKLLDGLDGVALSNKLTREQACQMAWNAMNYTPSGTSSEYVVFTDTDTDGVVDAGETVHYRGTDAVTALLMQNANAGSTLALINSNAGSLADVMFGLKDSVTTDKYGRTTKTWTSTLDNTVNVVLADDDASYTFDVTAAATVTDDASLLTAINGELGLTGTDALTGSSISQIVNGNTAFANLGVGDTVEVYASNAGVVSKVVVISEDVDAATLGAEITSGANKGLYTWTFGSATTVAAKDAYTANAYYVVIANSNTNAVLDIKVPTVVSGAKITSADKNTIADATYMTINGDKVYKAGNYDASVTGSTVNFNTAYDYILDSKGNVLYIADAATAVVEDPLETGYAYLLAAEQKVTTTAASSGLLNGAVPYSWNVVAKAQLAMADGTTQVVDLTTEVTYVNGEVTAAKVNGVAISDVTQNDSNPVNLITESGEQFNNVTWVKYTVQKDGTYTLDSVTGSSIALTKDDAKVDSKTATSATVWTLYDYNEGTKTLSAVSVTGIANFVTGSYTSVYTTSATNSDVITAINSFKTTTPATTTSTTYAYYVGQGDYDGTVQAYAQKFYIDGEVKEYFTTSDVTTDTTAADNKLVAGKVYVLTIDSDGEISAATYQAYTAEDKEVTLIDETFALIDGTAVYFSANCKVFNVSTGHTGETDTLSTKVTTAGSGDQVSYVLDNNGKVDVIYITTEAN